MILKSETSPLVVVGVQRQEEQLRHAAGSASCVSTDESSSLLLLPDRRRISSMQHQQERRIASGDPAASKVAFHEDTFLAKARERARNTLAPSEEKSAFPMEEEQRCIVVQDLSYLLRSTKALTTLNTEIWERCQAHSSWEIMEGVLPFSRISIPQVKTTVDPSMETTTFRIRTTVISKDFGALPPVPRELSELLAVPFFGSVPQQEQHDHPGKTTGDHETTSYSTSFLAGAGFPDYATYLDRATLLRDEALVPFLMKLKDHLESVHVFLGSIEAWIIETQCQAQFLKETFDGISGEQQEEEDPVLGVEDDDDHDHDDHDNQDENGWVEHRRDPKSLFSAAGGDFDDGHPRLFVPCGANGGDQRCCTFPHRESSICLRCQKPYKAHHRGLSRHGILTHLCDYHTRNVGSFLKTIDDNDNDDQHEDIVRVVHRHRHNRHDYCQPDCRTDSGGGKFVSAECTILPAVKDDGKCSMLLVDAVGKKHRPKKSGRFVDENTHQQGECRLTMKHR